MEQKEKQIIVTDNEDGSYTELNPKQIRDFIYNGTRIMVFSFGQNFSDLEEVMDYSPDVSNKTSPPQTTPNTM